MKSLPNTIYELTNFFEELDNSTKDQIKDAIKILHKLNSNPYTKRSKESVKLLIDILEAKKHNL